jgi:hypothetical protein
MGPHDSFTKPERCDVLGQTVQGVDIVGAVFVSAGRPAPRVYFRDCVITFMVL